MRAIVALIILFSTALPGWADAVTLRLLEVTQAERLMVQLAEEADRTGADIDQDFLGGTGGALLADTVQRLNAPSRVLPMLEAELTENMTEDERQAVLSFFESDLGRQIIELELTAREAFFDQDLEDAVKQRVSETGVPDLVGEIIRESDLIDRNVRDSVVVLTQFYLGRRAGGMQDMTEGQIAAFIREMETAIRSDTRDWLNGFLTLAYSPLAEADLQIYADFWKTDAGKAYDRALFAAFREIFSEANYGLGQMVGRLQSSEDI